MAYITVGLDENKVYKKGQPPGGRCSDWVPTSPLPDQGARVQKPSLSRDQMTSQLTNQMGQMNLDNQGRGHNTSQANPNPRMAKGRAGPIIEEEEHLIQRNASHQGYANNQGKNQGYANTQGYKSHQEHANQGRASHPPRRVQRQSTTTGDYGLSVDEMLEHNSAVAKGAVSRFQPHFEASDRRRTPGGLLRHAPVEKAGDRQDGKKVTKMPPGAIQFLSYQMV